MVNNIVAPVHTYGVDNLNWRSGGPHHSGEKPPHQILIFCTHYNIGSLFLTLLPILILIIVVDVIVNVNVLLIVVVVIIHLSALSQAALSDKTTSPPFQSNPSALLYTRLLVQLMAQWVHHMLLSVQIGCHQVGKW